MNTFPEILRRSNYGFLEQLAPDRQLYESRYTGTLIVIDWQNCEICPAA